MKKILAATAAMSLIAAPAMAANPAAGLSVAKSARVGAAPAKKSQLANGGGFWVVGVAAIAVIIGVVLIASDDLSDSN